MLTYLIKRHKNLNLVAVKGTTGVIPTKALGYLPDSKEKRAVADYFMEQGKLTGADYTAICDHPGIELFGAEDKTLYENSLKLIQEFTTAEKQGIVIELHDMLMDLEKETYHPALLDFESKRHAFNQGEVEVKSYQRDLTKQARAQKIALLPEALEAKKRQGKPLDFSDQGAQTRYLEKAVAEAMIQNEQEASLYQQIRFIEIAENILNVSASQEDLALYKAMQAHTSLAQIAKTLEIQLKDFYYFDEDEILSLDEGIKQGLAFYVLAQKRDKALLDNTLVRTQQRQEDRVALVTGGFHTEAISDMAKAKGYNVVTLRPRITGYQENNPYFELLSNPEKPTDLERLLSNLKQIPSAMAIRNQVGKVSKSFMEIYSVVKQVGLNMEIGGLTIEQRTQEIKILTNELGEKIGIQTLRNQVKILSKKELLQKATQKMTPLFKTIQNFVTVPVIRKTIVTTSMAAGVLFLLPLLGAVLSDAVVQLIAATGVEGLYVGNISMFFGLQEAVGATFEVTPLGDLNVYQHDFAEALIATEAIASTVSQGLPHGIFMLGGDTLILVAGIGTLYLGRTTEERYGRNLPDINAQRAAAKTKFKEEDSSGDAVVPDWEPPTDGTEKHIKFINKNDVKDKLNLLAKLGLKNYAQIMTADYYKERKDQETKFNPIQAEIDSDTLLILRQTDIMSDDFMESYISNAYNIVKDETPETYKRTRMFIPRLLITHPLIVDNLIKIIMDSYNPKNQRLELTDTEWNRLFAEFTDPDYGATVKYQLELIIQETTARQQPEAILKNLRQVLIHGILHEASHPLANHMPPEWEDEFEDLIFDNPKGVIEFKGYIGDTDIIITYNEGNLGSK